MASESVHVVREVSKKAKQSELSREEQELRDELEATRPPLLPTVPQDVKDRMLENQAAAKRGEFRVEDLAAQLNIPPGFILTIAGKPYVTKEGLLAQARRIGFDAIQADVHEDGNGGYTSEARVYRTLRPHETHLLEAMVAKGHEVFLEVYRDLRRPTVAHGSANKDNVKMSAMHAYLRELAETRAINRALRLYTGCGLVSVDELPEAGA